MRASSDNTTYFKAGNAKLTRRIKSASKLRGRSLTEDSYWNGHGYSVRGYYCDPDVYREVTEGIAREGAEAEAKRQAKLARAEARRVEDERQRRQEREAELQRRFPLLTQALRADCLEGRAIAYGPGDPIPADVYSRRQWQLLGGRVAPDANPVGYSVRVQGALRTPLFGPGAVVRSESLKAKWDAPRLWRYWRAGFPSDPTALATAVRFANRLIKFAPFATHKETFYRVKDRFIRFALSHMVECRVSREEQRECWGCDGTGKEYGRRCWRCGGTGVYSSRTLYEYLFEIDGKEFCFHSFMKPPVSVSGVPGADLASYGRRFTAAELSRVRLRVPEFTRVIEWFLDTQASGQ